MNSYETIKKYAYTIAVTTGVFFLAIFIWHLLSFNTEYYSNATFPLPFIGTNIVAAWADFFYFTYWSLFLCCTWLIAWGVVNIFKKKKTWLNNHAIILSLTTYQIFVCTCYTLFQFYDGYTLGWYGNYALSYIAVAENILIHYLLPTFFVFLCFIIKTNKPLKPRIYLTCIFPLLYFISFLAFQNFLPIEWYPYPISSPRAIWLSFWGSMEGYNAFYSVLIFVLALVVVFILFCAIYLVLLKLKNKQWEKNNCQPTK